MITQSWIEVAVTALHEIGAGATARQVTEHLGYDPDKEPGRYATISAALAKAARRGMCSRTRPMRARYLTTFAGHVSVYTAVSSLPSDATNIRSILSG